MSWRKATAEDVGEMTQMIEIAYHLGDEFFVDYNLIDPTTNQKYTRTTYEQIMNVRNFSLICPIFFSPVHRPLTHHFLNIVYFPLNMLGCHGGGRGGERGGERGNIPLDIHSG